MKNDLMLIGEIADFFGISRKAIRLYEKKGIIRPVKVDPANGYRYYSAEQVQQLNALLELKTLGFSLDEIKTIIDGGAGKGALLEMLERKRRAWKEAMELAKYKGECLGSIIQNFSELSGGIGNCGNDRGGTGVVFGKNGVYGGRQGTENFERSVVVVIQ